MSDTQPVAQDARAIMLRQIVNDVYRFGRFGREDDDKVRAAVLESIAWAVREGVGGGDAGKEVAAAMRRPLRTPGSLPL